MGRDETNGRLGPSARAFVLTLGTGEAAVLLGLAATLLFRAMAQDSMHWFDSLTAWTWARESRTHHPGHLLAMAPLSLACRALEPFGVDAMSACRWVMATGGGITVAAAFLAAKARGLGQGACWFAAACALCLPGVGYFATVVELQAMGMAAAALALWQASLMGRVGTLGHGRAMLHAVGCGLLCALAAGLHTSLHVLPMLLPLLAAGGLWPWMPMRRLLACGLWPFVVVLATHALCYAVLLILVDGMDALSNFGNLVGTGFYEEPHPASALQRLAWEYLLPFAPASWLLIAASWNGIRQSRFLLLAAGCLLAASAVVLRGFRIDENGAYLLLLCLPLSLHAAQRPRRHWPLLLCCGLLGGALLRWKQADVRRADPQLAAAAREVQTRNSCCLLLGKGSLLDSIALFAPDLKFVAFPLQRPVEPGRAAEVVEGFEALLALQAPRGLFIDSGTWDQWDSGRYGAMQELTRRHIPTRHAPVWLDQGPLRGVLIRAEGDGATPK